MRRAKKMTGGSTALKFTYQVSVKSGFDSFCQDLANCLPINMDYLVFSRRWRLNFEILQALLGANEAQIWKKYFEICDVT